MDYIVDKVLIKFKRNWADEFDVYGFDIYSKEEWSEIEEALKNYTKEISFWFGSNEGFDQHDKITGPDWLSYLKVTPIDQHEYETLMKLFKNDLTYGYGHFPLESICETIMPNEYWEKYYP